MELQLGTIPLMIAIIAVLVFVHELGHFLAAKFFKMEVLEFAIGFGKVLYRKHYKGTDYCIRLIPLGGFVQLEGETSSEGKNSFRNHPYYQKVIVLSAGVVMNFLFAVLILLAYLPSVKHQYALVNMAEYSFSNTEKVQKLPAVIEVSENSLVKEYFKENEIVSAINGVEFNNYKEFFAELEKNQNKEIEVTFLKLEDGSRYSRRFLGPTKNEDGSILRVTFSADIIYLIKYKQDLLSGPAMAYDVFIYQIKVLGGMVSDAFSTGNYAPLGQSVTSIVAAGDIVNDRLKANDLSAIVNLTALISVSLAFFNILPIPALDGGHILIITIEKITRRRLSDKWLNAITTTGYVLVMGLGIVVILKDVIQLLTR